MKNYEKYQKQIINILKEGNCIAVKDGKPVDCSSILCEECDFFREEQECNCKAKLGKWLEAEYVAPTVDWSKIAVDTKVIVSENGDHWFKRYFAGVKDGEPTAWDNGVTSWSARSCNCFSSWKYMKLYKEGEEE